jgi:hypothetical protein
MATNEHDLEANSKTFYRKRATNELAKRIQSGKGELLFIDEQKRLNCGILSQSIS